MLHRLERVRDELRTQQLDALLVTDAANRRYLSGFTGSAGALLITPDRTLLLSDFRYRTQAGQEAPNFEFRLIESGGLSLKLPDVVRELGIARLGFEANAVTVADFGTWRRVCNEADVAVQWMATYNVVEYVRQIKDAAEIETLRRAIAISDDAFAAIRPLLRPEMRERDVAWELEKAMRERGADALAFEIIVAAGDNGSRPHARAGSDQLGVGRPVVMDFGAKLNGYHADMTRTVILGEVNEQFTTIYNIVRNAQQATMDGIRTGMPGREADALARDVITAAGYGDNFGHGLGHGVGLQIHEAPSLGKTSEAMLPANSIFSIEPGIYLSGWGGVRIEDLVLLTDAGVEVLTQSPKEPLVEL